MHSLVLIAELLLIARPAVLGYRGDTEGWRGLLDYRYADTADAHEIAPKIGAKYSDSADAHRIAPKVGAGYADTADTHKIAPKIGAR